MTPRLSIIVPVYNAAHFLEECLQSLLSQSLTNIEVICINDGSIDHSLSILNDYASKEKRIKVYSQENLGVSVARNNGIRFATGNYVGFIDADDYIAPDYFQRFIEASPADLVGIKPYDGFKNIELNTSYQNLNAVVFEHMLTKDSFNSVCYKIFNLSIIKQFDVQFPIGMRLGEDAHFIMRFLQYAGTVTLINDSKGYFYRENFESATKSAVKDNSVFDRVFSEYQFDHKSKFNIQLSEEQILNAKLQKFINSYLSALSIYLRSNPIMSKSSRWQLVKTSMVQFKTIYESTKHLPIWVLPRGRFERLVLIALQKQRFGLIKLLFAYSHWRNGIK